MPDMLEILVFIISFHYRFSPRKTSRNVSKYPKNPILGPFAQIGAKNEFFWNKGLSVFQYLNYLPLCQKS